MKRLLLLMTTRTWRAGAFLAGAARAGAPVVVASDRPQALQASNPDGHLTLDFADPRSLDTIERFADRVPIGAVIGTDDEAVLLAARAAARLGLRHADPSAVATLRDKGRARAAFAAAGLPSPRFVDLPEGSDPEVAARVVAFPCVLKPVALSASRGVIRADDPGGFVAAFRRIAALFPVSAGGATRAPRILVESFLPGEEVALEGVLEQGRLRVVALFDKPDPLDGPFFEESLYITPSRHEPRHQDRLIQRVEEAARIAGLREGPIHAEARLHGGEAWLIEAAPRSIGGLCSRAICFEDGSSLEEAIVRQSLGLPVATWRREARASGVMMIPVPAAGILERVEGTAQARGTAGIEDVVITAVAGERLVPAPEGDRYPGFLFAKGASPREVESSLREAHRRLRFVVRDDPGRRPSPRAPRLDRC